MLLGIPRLDTFWVDTQIYRLCRSVNVDYVGTEVQNPITFHICTVHLDITKFLRIHHLVHWWVVLKNNINIDMKIYIKTGAVLK